MVSSSGDTALSYVQHLAIALIPIAFSAYAVIVFLVYEPAKPSGHAVTKESAPHLLDLISDTATKIGYKGKINEVLLTPGLSVRVYYEPTLKNFLSDSSCKLYIGTGLCHFLSKTELQAVIGHELAHFAQPQTKYKAYLARMTNISKMLGNNGVVAERINSLGWNIYDLPSRFFCGIFNSMFERVLDENSAEYVALNNAMEIEADNISASVFGKQNMLSALSKSISVNARLGIYKNLILPYIKSYGYRINGYWNTFSLCSSLFETIDGLNIDSENRLTEVNRSRFNASESSLPLRLKTLAEGVDTHYPADAANALTQFPSNIVDRMDGYLCQKYGHLDGEIISKSDLEEILNGLSNELFTNVSDIESAYAVMANVIKESLAIEEFIPQIIVPEYATPPL